MSNNEIGLGTAAIGRPLYININNTKTSEDFSQKAFRQKGIAILEEAYQQGIRYFDTSPGYGMAEQMLIDWVLEKDDESIEIATKWGYTYVANFEPNAKQHEIKEHSLAKLNEQWINSKILLPLLTTYQVHSATLETGILDNNHILHRMAELKNEHDLLIGITTTGANQKEVLQKALEVEVDGNPLFDQFQVTYNVFDQSLASILSEMSKQNKRIIIKEAMANGRVFPNEKYSHYRNAYDSLNQLALKYEVGVDAIAMRFCLDSIPSNKVLSGAATLQHLSDNLKAIEFKLGQDDLAILSELAINPIQYWNERKQMAWN